MGSKGGVVYSQLLDIVPIYCSGVAHCHLEHGNLHVAYYRNEIAGDGTLERVIVFKLIIPEDAVMDGRAVVNFEIAAHRHVSGAMVGTA